MQKQAEENAVIYGDLPDKGRIKVGRLAFLTVSAIPISIFICSVTGLTLYTPSDPTVGLIFAIIMLCLSVPLMAVGALIMIWKAVRRESILFWFCSTVAVALPTLYLVGLRLYYR